MNQVLRNALATIAVASALTFSITTTSNALAATPKDMLVIATTLDAVRISNEEGRDCGARDADVQPRPVSKALTAPASRLRPPTAEAAQMRGTPEGHVKLNGSREARESERLIIRPEDV